QILIDIKKYVDEAKNKSEQDRTATDKEKTGVESGLTAINSANGAKIPIYIADYVLMGYGTGAIMAVPAHDERDFEFAKKFNLPITQVIASAEPMGGEAYVGSGKIMNSGEWDGWETPGSIDKVIDYLEERGIGKGEANYHLRDWLISRQRYWGPPIPMIFCKSCEEAGRGEREDMPGWYVTPIDHLPVLLPDVKDWKPMGSGESPLANHPEFYKTTCPHCKSEARRETDVSDTFLDSAWYYLRYLSIGNDKRTSNNDQLLSNVYPYDIDILKKWCPVAIYIGGAEHSVLHLLYVRFVAMVLHDLKNQAQNLALNFEEPFPRFFAHGLIVKDGAKMSKSRGNVVVPDQYITKFGADTLRLYLMFIGQFKDGGDFRDSGIEGMNRFVRRVWTLLTKPLTSDQGQLTIERRRFMNKTIKGVTEDIESFSYNTAISKIMEWYNFLTEDISKNQKPITKNEIEVFLKLLAPFAPHMTEELWKVFDLGEGSVHFSSWPTYDEKYLVTDEVVVPIQVNGKRRGEIVVQSSKLKDQSEIETRAKEIIKSYLEGREVKKVIYVPGKIINFVI
ncbi:MAG TPA: class I tRNA ligase family protein, partial [Patescibacteria group bacterium]|nr:class I tRNA ligase family protein [Patescibacteria group bacterium]